MAKPEKSGDAKPRVLVTIRIAGLPKRMQRISFSYPALYALIFGNVDERIFSLNSKRKGIGSKEMRKSRLLQALLVVTLLLSASLAAAKTVTLSWSASPSQIAGYKLYYKAGSSAVPLDGTGATQGSSPIDIGNVLTYTVTGLPDADDHYFTLTAYD